MADARTLGHKLGLGTVQWGLKYGVANRGAKVGIAEVASILDVAAEAGVSLLDTAYSYGDAEDVIGRLSDRSAPFTVVTKTKPALPGDIGAAHVDDVARAIDESLRRLSGWAVAAILVHDCDSLFRRGGERLWRYLADQKAVGRVAGIGVSVYAPDQARRAVAAYGPDLIQLPLNIYDQRFITSGTLAFLKQRGVEIHTRSAFLQGLMLMAPTEMPPHFDTVRAHHAALHAALAEAKTSPLSAALRFCLAQPEVDRVIVGCESAGQLREILAASAETGPLPPTTAFAIEDEKIINPSLWRLQA